MLPVYNLVVDITAADKALSEKKFRAQVEPHLIYFDALRGAFHRGPCSITYYPPNEQHKTEYWSVRAVVMVSLGKQRADYLIQLYKAVVRLLELELPQFRMQAEVSVLRFS